jgi:hypothetical protein
MSGGYSGVMITIIVTEGRDKTATGRPLPTLSNKAVPAGKKVTRSSGVRVLVRRTKLYWFRDV